MSEKKYKVGYTQGVYDMFHIGHLNLLNQAKEHCDYLIVGVNSDQLVQEYKHKIPVIPQEERMLIVSNIKAVDDCLLQDTLDKVAVWNQIHFDVVFIGDDWKGDARWLQTEKDLAPLGAEVMYLSHTDGVSSTILRPQNGQQIKDSNV